jgi:hypothetical protein
MVRSAVVGHVPAGPHTLQSLGALEASAVQQSAGENLPGVAARRHIRGGCPADSAGWRGRWLRNRKLRCAFCSFPPRSRSRTSRRGIQTTWSDAWRWRAIMRCTSSRHSHGSAFSRVTRNISRGSEDCRSLVRCSAIHLACCMGRTRGGCGRRSDAPHRTQSRRSDPMLSSVTGRIQTLRLPRKSRSSPACRVSPSSAVLTCSRSTRRHPAHRVVDSGGSFSPWTPLRPSATTSGIESRHSASPRRRSSCCRPPSIRRSFSRLRGARLGVS